MVTVISRRGVLGFIGAVGAGALLAACGGAPSSAPAAPPTGFSQSAANPTAAPQLTTAQPTEAPQQAAQPTSASQPAGKAKVTVELVAASWVIEEWKLTDWVKRYNALGGNQIHLTQSVDGWDTKVLAMIRQGDVLWDGEGVMSPHQNKVEWVETEMIQPVDAFLESSTEPDAKKIVSDMIPTVKQDISYKGKVYGIPYSVEAIGQMWLNEFVNGVGLKGNPATWSDTFDAAMKIKEKYSGQKVTPYAFNPAIHTSIEGLIMSGSKTPYTSEGLLDITGDVGLKACEWMINLAKAGVLAPHGTDGAVDIWQKRKLGLLMAQNSRGVWAQRIFGMAAAGTGAVPQMEKDGPTSGSPFWANTFVVLNKAKHPQEMVDFYAWLLGPSNTDVWQAIIASGKAPVLNSTYQTMIENNADYKWMADFLPVIAASVPYPENTFWVLQNTKIMPWINKMLTPPFNLLPKDAMAGALKDVKAEVAKQKVR